MLFFTSEPRRPAFWAGPSVATEITMNPLVSSNPAASAKFGLMSVPTTPIHGWRYSPSLIRYGTIFTIVVMELQIQHQ